MNVCGAPQNDRKTMINCLKKYFPEKKRLTMKDIKANMHQLVDFYEKFETVNKLEKIQINETQNYDLELLEIMLIELESDFIVDPDHVTLDDLQLLETPKKYCICGSGQKYNICCKAAHQKQKTLTILEIKKVLKIKDG